MAKIPKVDPELCIGCGTCVVIAPKSFKLDKEGKAEVIVPLGDDEATLEDAANSCAVSAITFVEEDEV